MNTDNNANTYDEDNYNNDLHADLMMLIILCNNNNNLMNWTYSHLNNNNSGSYSDEASRGQHALTSSP